MRVLVGCEFSGAVRDAFIAKGHDAWSCDIIPCIQGGPHLQCDVLTLLDQQWDLAIFHPPCTYLCSSGLHWNKRRPERAALTEAALEFVRILMKPRKNIRRWALENPVGCISSQIRKPNQIIQPWQFGHPESKTTCLWLSDDLPPLEPTNILQPIRFQSNGRPQWDNMTPSGQNKLGPSDSRGADRAVTYSGIASAFADQWGRYAA